MVLWSTFRELAEREGLRDAYPDAVHAEVSRWLRAPGIDDPGLVDWTALPFVTIDGPHTRDLDQAVYVEATPAAGFRLLYAIADASFYVPPESALFAEALQRGSSFYLPGQSIPMLPRALSEHLISLAPGVDRRALVFDVRLDRNASVETFELVRAKIRSRHQLAFGEVDQFLQHALIVAGPQSPIVGRPYEHSLRLLAELGRLRESHEDRRQVVRFRRVETEVKLREGGGVEVVPAPRGAIELATEQVSILCNSLGARFLQQADPEHVQPIYRVHAPPDEEKVAAFERLVHRLARLRGLPDDPWVYRRAAAAGLAGYLEALPTQGAEGRVARALHRQAMLLQGRSFFRSEAGEHHGVGATVYARFTAPMREVVGVFCHKEAIERVTGRTARTREADEAIRLQVIDAANRARDVQRRLDKEIERRIVAEVLGPDLSLSFDARPARLGTVMGISSSKVHVLLDHPPIDVRIPLREQGACEGGAWLDVDAEGSQLSVRGRDRIVCRLGDRVAVRSIGPEAVVILPDCT